MSNISLHTRCARAALAAALAISATPALAQEAVGPLAPAEPVITPVDEPSATAAPVASEPTTAPVEATSAEPVATAAPARRVAPARAAPRPAQAAASSSPATTVAPAEPVAPSAPTPVASAEPIVPATAAAPAPEATPAPVADSGLDEGALLAGAAGIAVLGLAGAALVGRRRRRAVGSEPVFAEWSEPVRAKTVRPGNFVKTSVPADSRPAFAWGSAAPASPAAPKPHAAGDWIAAAHRGPTPDNPSLSLKKRLKRAAFFEQRERAVRMGKADPVNPAAGLPRKLVEQVRANTRPAQRGFVPAFQPA